MPCFFKLPEAICIPHPYLSSISRTSNVASLLPCFHHPNSFSKSSLLPPSSTFTDPFGYILTLWQLRMLSLCKGWLLSKVNSVFNLNSPLPHDITYSQFLENRKWTSLPEGCYFLSTLTPLILTIISLNSWRKLRHRKLL